MGTISTAKRQMTHRYGRVRSNSALVTDAFAALRAFYGAAQRGR